MKKRKIYSLITTSLLLGIFASCNSTVSTDVHINTSDTSIISSEELSSTEVSSTPSSMTITESEQISSEETNPSPEGSLTLEEAKAMFEKEYPYAEIEVSKAQGKAYFIQGWNGNTLCQMKIMNDGTILYSQTKDTERPENLSTTENE